MPKAPPASKKTVRKAAPASTRAIAKRATARRRPASASSPIVETSAPPRMIWPNLHYAAPRAAIEFLVKAFGFTVTEISESADGIVQHAELRFPEGGGVMIGTALVSGNEFQRLPPGVNSVYVVTDDPDGIFGRATAAGAIVVRALKDEDYGSRGFTITDPEGNFWSFGTYRGV